MVCALHQIKNAHTNNEVFAKIHERVQDKSSRRNLFYIGVLKFEPILLPPEVWERLKCRQKNCVHNLPVNKKNALRISRQTYNNQNSIKGAGGWYLVFTHGIEITAWTGNVSGIFYSNLPSWKWGDGFTFSSQHLWPLFFAYLFLLSLAHKLCNDHKWSIKRPWKRKIVSGPRKLTLKLRA